MKLVVYKDHTMCKKIEYERSVADMLPINNNVLTVKGAEMVKS